MAEETAAEGVIDVPSALTFALFSLSLRTGASPRSFPKVGQVSMSSFQHESVRKKIRKGTRDWGALAF